jgi:hypothetical protein
MKKKKLLIVVTATLTLAVAIHCLAQSYINGLWRAASKTAASITGDIAISDAKVTINFKSFPLAPIRSLQPAEVAAVFDADVNTSPPGNLFRLNVPASFRLLHRNTLCGSDDTQWMATYLDGKTLQVAFFSGDDVPVFTMEAMANSTRLCGVFSYAR